MKNKLIRKKVKFAKQGVKGLGVDVVAPVLLGLRYNSLSDKLKEAYKVQYESNPELFDNLYYNTKRLEYNQVFDSPKSKPEEIKITSNEVYEPELKQVKLNIKESANSNKWVYSRQKAAELFDRPDLNTAYGVAYFLANHGLDVDGMLGENTLRVLNSLYGKNVNPKDITKPMLLKRKDKPEDKPKDKTLLEIVNEKYPDMLWKKEYVELFDNLNDFEKYAFLNSIWSTVDDNGNLKFNLPFIIERNKEISRRHSPGYFGYAHHRRNTDGTVTTLHSGSKYDTYTGKDGLLYGYDKKTGKEYKLKLVKKSSRTVKPVGKIIDRIFKHTDGNYYFRHSDGKGVTKLEKLSPYYYRFTNKDGKTIIYNPVILRIRVS